MFILCCKSIHFNAMYPSFGCSVHQLYHLFARMVSGHGLPAERFPAFALRPAAGEKIILHRKANDGATAKSVHDSTRNPVIGPAKKGRPNAGKRVSCFYLAGIGGGISSYIECTPQPPRSKGTALA